MQFKFFAVLLCSLIVIPQTAFGVSGLVKDNFNNYPVGVLDGGNKGKHWTSPWMADSRFEVEKNFTFEGKKAVHVAMVHGTEPDAYRTFTPQTKGSIHFAMGKDDISHAPGFIVQSGNTMALLIFIGSDFQQGRSWFIREGYNQYAIAPYIMGTFGTVDIEFDITAQHYRASVNGGAFTNWYGLVNPVASVDTIRLHSASADFGAANLYWDDIKISNKHTQEHENNDENETD